MWGKKNASAAQVVRERKEEEVARNALFAGQEGEIVIDPTQLPVEEQTTDQLVRTAQQTHKETTQAAQRALKVIEESKQIQAETMKNLEDQNKKMWDIHTRMDDMNEELTYAEKLLSYMRRCCCCWLCDSCTGADPEEQRKRAWQRRVAKGKTAVPAGRGQPPQQGRGGAGEKANGGGGGNGAGGKEQGGTYRNPDIRLPDEHRGVEMGLHEETRKQDEVIDQIHAGLEHLLEGARGMHGELAAQNKELDALDDKAAATRDRINDVNKNSQLRNMARGKPKPSKEEPLVPGLPSKNDVALAAAKRLAGV
ncbi:hypothetical protein CHLRE_02g100250v5 [Chlamydomonas reinhardtii]|uniref:t-SNARE coiled-coil homology domain-containing protein n=1 Tax=Chlamydomonas reinhardtii TaxID=3055 RepID=A8I4X5_CHLRE|nr:uncharacterized protein CHLRE_02g100250v5 [Chlamydomonas reinhardtii]PNW86893.1 hypothetical protein CHLRE_02g100250v5 [Chlamydomonas reinhardtii]|eukprot:XP_001700019.1 Qb+c-SNARE protein, SNAP25-family [Chlamydomonas reinhardtii]